MNFREKISKNAILIAFSMTGIFIFLAIVFQASFYYRNNPEKIRNNFFRTISEKENLVNTTLENLARLSPEPSILFKDGINTKLNALYDKHGFVFFVFRKDSLVYWSQNSVELPGKLLNSGQIKSQFIRLSNGWYELMLLRKTNITCIGLIPIKSEFSFENDFLKNDFQKDFHIPSGSTLQVKNDAAGHDRIIPVIPSKTQPSEIRIFLLFLLYLFGLVCLVLGIYGIYLKFEYIFSSKLLLLGTFVLDIIILRYLLCFFRIPRVLYNSELFSPVHFSSSSFLPSFGDFFINSILLLMIAYILYLHLKPGHETRLKLFPRIILVSMICISVIAGFLFALYLIRNLLINSTISFNLQNIAGLNLYSILGFTIIAILILSWFLISVSLIRFLPVFLKIPKGSFKNIMIPDKLSTSKIILFLILFSIIVTLVLDHVNASIEKEKRKFLALTIGTQHDPVAEMMFADIEDELLHDSILFRIGDRFNRNPAPTEDSLESYLMNTYFSSSWNNYFIQITVCSPEKKLGIQPQNVVVNCESYFRGILKESGKNTESSHLFILDYGYGSKNYLATIPLVSLPGGKGYYTAYIEISSKLVFKDLGYPELLTDAGQSKMPDITGYSYAFYRDNKLIYRFGKYQYPLNLELNVSHKNLKNGFYKSDEMDHYYQLIDSKNVLILSKTENSFLTRAAPFSYLFFFFAIVVILFSVVVRFPDSFNFNNIRLENRLQVSMIAILTGSLLITGFLILFYIVKLNNDKNHESLNERSHSVLVELQHHWGSQESITFNGPENLNDLLTRFSNIFFTDINLYTPDGRLFATSRPQVFEQGLISGFMNRNAYSQLKYGSKSMVIQKESIGTDHYYSSYVPLFNDRNELLAYLNLPYFARQEDLSREISTFLIAFINIYIFIIIAGIFIALVVSSYISRPVRLLTSGIGNLTFGKTSEKLKWKRKDEIGKLVEEYNRMVDELVKSAELLARSERESAWREMARQIAHEIKNPLTPMKLSIQHLQKAWEEKAPDWGLRVKRFTETMIRQIESLSAIASDFSDFAKMPLPFNETLDLNEIIRNTITLYREIPSMAITFETKNPESLVFADRGQITRVFTNLINNAIQAIGSRNDGAIHVSLITVHQNHIITVSDNGSGIPADQVKKVFEPNFTTKSGGMGLGLAIVKNIIMEAGGEISFKSENNKGTEFQIILPALFNE